MSPNEPGFEYIVEQDFGTPSDSLEEPTRSRLRVYEDGVELGPSHALHRDIQRYGRGRFSHWSSDLRFSASDNSNPRSNGRRYTYRVYDAGGM